MLAMLARICSSSRSKCCCWRPICRSAPQHVENVLALGQLALQRNQAHHIAGQLGVLLAAVGPSCSTRRAVAVADGGGIAEHFSGWLGIGHQHAWKALAQEASSQLPSRATLHQIAAWQMPAKPLFCLGICRSRLLPSC